MFGLLFTGFAAGILAAELWLEPFAAIATTAPLILLTVACVIVAGWVGSSRTLSADSSFGTGLASQLRRGRGRGLGRRATTATLRHSGDATSALRSTLGLTIAFCVSFTAGSIRLGLPLESAASDAATASQHLPQKADLRAEADGIRMIEARVQSREIRSWGDEVILFPVRTADAGPAVPARLRLAFESTHWPRPSGLATETEEVPAPRTRADELLWPGSVARLGVRIRPLSTMRNPGTEDRARSAARRGIGAQARLVDPDWVLGLSTNFDPFRSESLREQAYAARSGWRDRVRKRFASMDLSAGLAQALAVGDRTSLDPDVASALRRLGLAHLIAVSGLHVSLVAGAVGWLATRMFVFLGIGRRSPYAPFLLSLLTAWSVASVYGWMSGAGVSIQRAVLLFGFYAVFRIHHRSLQPFQALSGVALVLLVLDPAVLFELGAQLSFLACGAMIMAGFWGESGVSPPLENTQGWVARGRSALGESFRVSLAISFATAPVLFGVGFVVPALAPLWNVVAIPWTALLALPASIIAVLSIDVLSPQSLKLLLLPTQALEFVAVRVDEVVGVVESWQVLPAIGVLGIAGIGVALVRVRRTGIALIVWSGLVLLGSPPSLHGAVEALPPRVIFFDVGQGDAALIQGREAAIVVDSGGGTQAGTAGRGLVRGLMALGVHEVNVLVVTHGDLDHRAGAPRILSELTVGELWLPAGGEQDDRLARLARHAGAQGTAVRWVSSKEGMIRIGDLELETLWPPPGGSAHRSRNDGSLVLAVVLGDSRVLFAADVGAAVEKDLLESKARIEADVLKIGHHGSLKSSTSAFLAAVSPTWAIVSAPCEAARGLPNPTILERLRRSGIEIGWTGRDGAVIFRGGRREGLGIERWARSRACGA